MANYYTQAVVRPEIPEDLLDKQARERLETCGFTCELTPEGWYLFSDEATGSDEDDVPYEEILQEVIRQSAGRLAYLVVEAALTCSKPRPDGFGGYAQVITADEVRHMSTSAWLAEHIPGSKGAADDQPAR